MKLVPNEDRIVIAPIDEERKLASGIILPDQAVEKPQHGEIVAIGPKVEESRAFEVGEKVLYSRFGGTEIELKGEKLLLIRQVDILGKVIEDDD